MIVFKLLILSSYTFFGIFSFPKPSEDYTKSVLLKAPDIYRVFWKITDDRILFEIQVKTKGWCGFGLSPIEGMTGADIFTAWIQDGKVIYHDRYAHGFFRPSKDEYQDWNLHFGIEFGDYSIYKFSRYLKTCHLNEDRNINIGTATLIWAFKDEKPVSVEKDISYHGHSNRGFKTVVLREKDLREPKNELLKNAKSFDFFVENFIVPHTTNLTYSCNFFDLPSLDKKHQIVAVEGVLNSSFSKSLVKSVEVYLCQSEPEVRELVAGGVYNCIDLNVETTKKYCTTIIYAWGTEGKRMYLPHNGGIPVEISRSIVFTKIRYENNKFIERVIENSGVRIFLTSNLRKYDYTILRLGVEVGPNMIIPPGEKSFKTVGHCSEMCLNEAFDMADIEEVTLTTYLAYLNSKGISMKARIFRGNEELEPIIIEDSYNYNYRTFVRLPKERKLKRGDRLTIECTYRTIDEDDEVIGGLGTEHEKCVAFFTVYPAISLTKCKSSPRAIEITQLYDNSTTKTIDWSLPNKGKIAQEIALSDHVVNYCSGIKKNEFKTNRKTYFVPTAKSIFSFLDKCDGFPRPTENYPNSVVLKSPNYYKLYWKVVNSTIFFEIQVKTKGWAGFGISKNGNMIGSDVIIAYKDKNGTFHFEDRYVTEYELPSVDKKQDWKLIIGKRYGSYIIAKFYRKLDTCDDDEDIVIAEGTTRIVWSFRDKEFTEDGRIRHHGRSNRGTTSLQLLEKQFSNRKHETVEGSFPISFRMSNFTVPSDIRTHYQCQLYKIPNLGKKHHVIALDALLNTIDSTVIHHMILRACVNNVVVDDNDLGFHFDCFGELNQKYPTCNPIIFVWNVGGMRQYFKEGAAYPFGRVNDVKYVKLEVHYNNLQFKGDIIDNSGLRLWMTDKLQREDIQVIEIGHVFSTEHIIPPKQLSFKTVSHCPAQCFNEAMNFGNIDSIKVVSVLGHGHFLIRAIKVRHIRDGVELEPILIENHYDFNFQNFVTLKEPREIIEGDRVTVECLYDSRERNNVTLGGIESINEMCLAYLTSYPSIPLTNCKTIPQKHKIKKLYGNNIESVVWTEEKIKEQQALSKDLDVEISCSFGVSTYPSDKTNATLSPIEKEYIPKQRLCSTENSPDNSFVDSSGNEEENSGF